LKTAHSISIGLELLLKWVFRAVELHGAVAHTTASRVCVHIVDVFMIFSITTTTAVCLFHRVTPSSADSPKILSTGDLVDCGS